MQQTTKIYCSQKEGCLTRLEYLPRKLDSVIFSFTVSGGTLLGHLLLARVGCPPTAPQWFTASVPEVMGRAGPSLSFCAETAMLS